MVRGAHPTLGIIHMPNYRRCYVPGGSYFFTVVTERRACILGTDLARGLLRAAFRDCFDRWPPFRVDALVMLRDHLHAIWTLPSGDAEPGRVRTAHRFWRLAPPCGSQPGRVRTAHLFGCARRTRLAGGIALRDAHPPDSGLRPASGLLACTKVIRHYEI